MGASTHYQAQLEHPELGLLTWDIWEYPVGVENSTARNVNGHEVIHDLRYGLEHVPDIEDADDWINPYIPNDPYEIFKESITEANVLVNTSGSAEGTGLINRMVFSHYITAMEAFLCDALLNAVSDDTTARGRLLKELKGLREQKFTLNEIAADPDIVISSLQNHLRSIVYHNLVVVGDLFKIALDIDIFQFIDDKDFLFKAVLLRHDCVRRNGKDKDGNILDVFTKDFVIETGQAIRFFIASLALAMDQRVFRGITEKLEKLEAELSLSGS